MGRAPYCNRQILFRQRWFSRQFTKFSYHQGLAVGKTGRGVGAGVGYYWVKQGDHVNNVRCFDSKVECMGEGLLEV